MKDKTKKLKELMWNHKEQYDRVGVLKDAFKGETAYICTSGPTFNQFPSEIGVVNKTDSTPYR